MTNKQIVFLVFIGIIILIITYGTMIEPYQIEVHHIWIHDTKLNHVLKGKTAFHISDLHISKIGKRENEILHLAENMKPDFIFLTGDYVSWQTGYEQALKFISSLRAGIGVWAVMGDYDYSNSRKSCLFCHEPNSGNPTCRHNVHFLKNTNEKIDLPQGYFWIGGMDCWSTGGYSEAQLNSLKESQPAIILSHRPQAFDLIDKNYDILMLAGDTHGGQILLPSFVWSALGYSKCVEYLRGFYCESKKKMYVSRGLGISHIPIRIFSRPELVVLHF